MRIDGLGRALPAPSGAPKAGDAGGVFRIADAAPSGAARSSAPASAAPSLGALLALQAMPEPVRGGRKREIARGRGLLDALDGLKLALVEGRADPHALSRLAQELAGRRETTGDCGLDDALSAIELRARVELAKRER